MHDSSKYTGRIHHRLIMTLHAQSTARGALNVACAFLIWGLLPLYLKPLNSLGALQIAAWRYLMGCITVLIWLQLRHELGDLLKLLRQPRPLWILAITAVLLAGNWIMYAWGVAHGQVLVTSLGYFINPLVNVLLGIVVLSERLNRWQWTAVGVAATGVALLTIHTGQVPWLALALACTFSAYGLIRKQLAVPALQGLAVETLLFAPLVLGYLLWHPPQPAPDQVTWTLLLLSGVVTIVPLALFNQGAQQINYATVGMLQYIGPSMQFVIGVWIYHETLSGQRLLCFALIWLALLIYALDSWRRR